MNTTELRQLGLPLEQLEHQIRTWLQEDVGSGDVSSWATIPAGQQANAIIHLKDEGVIAGIAVAHYVFHLVDPSLQVTRNVADGHLGKRGDVLLEVRGNAHSILTAERLALNLLQRMSGVATNTAQYVQALGNETTAKLADTRKTTPGHRALEKYAVRVGGGHNHRFGLYDAVMIKDNHSKAAGSIEAAVTKARSVIPHTMKIEVETESLAEVQQAIDAGADIIMLDNMSLELMRAAVQLIKSQSPHIVIEASGGVNLDTIRAIAQTGVQIISVGGLTYSFRSLDISLDLHRKKGDALS